MAHAQAPWLWFMLHSEAIGTPGRAHSIKVYLCSFFLSSQLLIPQQLSDVAFLSPSRALAFYHLVAEEYPDAVHGRKSARAMGIYAMR